MMKSQNFIALLPLLLLTSTTTINSRPTAINRRILSTNCDLLFGDCSDDQWPFDTPISTTTPFMSRPFFRSKTPRLPPIVVASPPPLFTNPSFSPPSVDTNDPTFSPLVASPPPPGYTNDPDQLSPPFYDDTDPTPPFIGISFSPPDNGNPSPEITLPPIVERNQPDLFMSPPQQNLPAPDMLNVPAPPLVPVDTHQQPEDSGKLPQLPPVVQSPPAP